jgi:hypothetical protein
MAVKVRVDCGLYATNPVLRGDGYHIAFPNDAPPEFVCLSADRSADEALVMCERVLVSLGISAATASDPRNDYQMIDGKWQGVYTIEIDLHEPLPAGLCADMALEQLAASELIV